MTEDLTSANPERQALLDELHRIGLSGSLVALIMTPEAAAGYALTSHVVVLPMEYVAAVSDDGRLDLETLALGLSESVEMLRPSGDTQLLGATLLSLARALRQRAAIDRLWEIVAEAIGIFERLGIPAQVGRCLVELGTVLRDADFAYDALTAYDRAYAHLSEAQDLAAMRTVHYHRAVICRQAGLYEEGILELDRMMDLGLAEEPNSRLLKTWRAERTACAIETGDLAGAETLIGDLIAESDDATDFNTAVAFSLRARTRLIRGERDAALKDLATAVAVSARSTAAYATPLFRTGEREQLEPLLYTALDTALRSDAPELAVGVLTLARSVRSGALRALSGPRADPVVRRRLTAREAALARRATEAGIFRRDGDLDSIARDASTLVDQRYVLTSSDAAAIPELAETVNQLRSAVLPGTLAVEVFVGPEGVLWLAAVSDTGLAVVPTRRWSWSRCAICCATCTACTSFCRRNSARCRCTPSTSTASRSRPGVRLVTYLLWGSCPAVPGARRSGRPSSALP
jgi:hypothetical protein